MPAGYADCIVIDILCVAAGDLTAGATSTGPVLRCVWPIFATTQLGFRSRATPCHTGTLSVFHHESIGGDDKAGILGSLRADNSGRAELVVMLPERIPVWDLIGRALVVQEDRAGSVGAAAVIARSAVAGDNSKKICACDGTLIWDAGDLIPKRPPKKV